MILVHGDNIVKSREALLEIKKAAEDKNMEVVILEGKKVELVDVKQAMESMGLFGNDRLVVIEGLFVGVKSKRQDEVVNYLKKNGGEVVLWEGKKVDLRRLGRAKYENREFKMSAEVFKLTEALRPGNEKQILYWWEKAKNQDAVELIFFMMVRQVRMMIEAFGGEMKGPGWLVSKAKDQARAVGMGRLLKWHEKLYEIECGVKTGRSELKLETQLELWLMSL